MRRSLGQLCLEPRRTVVAGIHIDSGRAQTHADETLDDGRILNDEHAVDH